MNTYFADACRTRFYYFVSKCTIACSSLGIEIPYVVYLEQEVQVYKLNKSRCIQRKYDYHVKIGKQRPKFKM